MSLMVVMSMSNNSDSSSKVLINSGDLLSNKHNTNLAGSSSA